jgi:RsiW-degrading membrane proteinase PrsW (M82 family)
MEIYHYNRNCGCTRCRCRGITGPVFLMALGVIALFDEFNVRNLDWGHSWPLLLIVLGITMFIQRSAPTDGHQQMSGRVPPPVAGGEVGNG